MLGLMQGHQLTTSMLVEKLEGVFASSSVVTGPYQERRESTFAQVALRARKLAAGLDTLGVPVAARVATLGWNSQEHLELYFGVPSSARVLHTINHRLAPGDIEYIINDAQDDVIFIDRSLLDVLWPLAQRLPTVRHIVVIDDLPTVKIPQDPRIVNYEELLDGQEEVKSFEPLNERAAAALCYTSGTTGRPKGVLYDHRSIILHAMSHLFADSFALGHSDVVMPIVPMFHANAWGLPYAVALSGSSLVLPGRVSDPERLAEMMEQEQVTVSAAVTTVWRSLLPHLRGRELTSLRRLANGGGALPVELSREYLTTVGVPIVGTWGMTEASPTLTAARTALVNGQDPKDIDQRSLSAMCAPGYPNPLIKIRLARPDGTLAVHDGKETGELQVAGPTIASGYSGSCDGSESFTEDGWLRTGDVGVIDPDGCIHVVDRLKDLIKSGGEWIGSVELENAIMSHPDVLEAAVVGRPDNKWGERPVAFVVLRMNTSVSDAALRTHLGAKVAKWWIPEDIYFVDDIPKTPTGKISKKVLRDTEAWALTGSAR
ncbi:long-chain fatty acid--CoA ligase [Glutamicibacter bergerei]|nr:long-chain fatty acid--CoA ligase [Micrococcaceae bacterium]